jgi:hypothetical protein
MKKEKVMDTCELNNKYKRIKICSRCFQKFDINSNLKVDDNCPNKGCQGKISFLEERLESYYVDFRKKHYLISMLTTGEFCDHGFIIMLYPFQCSEHLPKLPQGFKGFNSNGAFLMERKYKSTDPVKRHIEVEEAISVVEKYIKILPTVYILQTALSLDSKGVAEQLNKESLDDDGFFDSIITKQVNGTFSVEIFRVIKEDEAANEVGNLFSLYNDTKAILISYKLFT